MDWLNLKLENDILSITIDRNKISKVKIGGLHASLNAIRDIEKKYSQPYTLFCSGGVDSQSMAYAWKLSGIEHKIVLFEYVDDNNVVYNDHDLKTFYEFAKENAISYEVRQFNYFNFLENDLLNYAVKYDCASPQITCMIKLIESIGNGTIILSGNVWNNFYNELPINYDILGLYRFAQTCTNYSVIPFFFLYNIDLATGFKGIKREPTMNSYDTKVKIYKENGFPVISQETKISGFEKIKDYFDDKIKINFKDKLKFLNEPSKRAFDIEYRYKLRQMLGKCPEMKVNII